MATKKDKRVLFIYAGIALNNKDQKRYVYLNTENKDEESYKVKLWKHETIGTVIEATKTDTGVSQPYEHKGRVSKEFLPEYLDKITTWSVRDRASLEMVKVVSESKKEHPESVKELSLKLKNAIWSLSPRQRKVFALWFYNEIV